MASKSQIDRSGKVLSDANRKYDEASLNAEIVLDDFRAKHLQPLTELTLDIQNWLGNLQKPYYIAQRLKRKPQIIRKLSRLSVRLTQLQDIGGCRIIVDSIEDADKLIDFIGSQVESSERMKIVNTSDYRQRGRDKTGYRAFHYIIEKETCKLELQIRSNIQHYWSESIERTSIIYKNRLKEEEGHESVINYFRMFSDVLLEIEHGNSIRDSIRINLDESREKAERIIFQTSDSNAYSSFINEGIIKTLAEAESRKPKAINNWILVFNWKEGNFVTWDLVSRNASEAVRSYQQYENEFLDEEFRESNYEVVLIGSSDISTVSKTHSHYFGIEHHSSELESVESAIIGFSRKFDLDIGSRKILAELAKRKYWGANVIAVATLKNHFCRDVASFDSSLRTLIAKDYITGGPTVSLNGKMNDEISIYVGNL